MHLPRVLTHDAEPDAEPYVALYDLDNLRRTLDAVQAAGAALDIGTPPRAMRELTGSELATIAHVEFAARFAPHENLIAPRLPWIGYPATDPDREAPHAVAYLGTPGFAGRRLFLTYRRYLAPELGSWLAEFTLVDSGGPDSVWYPSGLAELCNVIYGYQASYEAWCQDGTDTAGPFEDFDPYEYADPCEQH